MKTYSNKTDRIDDRKYLYSEINGGDKDRKKANRKLCKDEINKELKIMEENKNINETSVKIGTVDEFHSQKCFDLYIYAISFAKQINDYLDKGYIVFDGTEVFKNKFVFYGNNQPYIAERSSNCSFIYFGNTFDKQGKVWLDDETKTSIKKRFSEFKFVKPCNIEYICFK